MGRRKAEDPEGGGAPPEPARESLSEGEQLLGTDVRSPVGIPRAYKPLEVSTHELLRIEITDFAGPLDLLLYLIRQHDLDIFDIPIAFITEQYLAMLDKLSDLPIDVAAEFLVMAAELAHIKSKMLLPPKEGVPVEAQDEEDADPRADLVRRLLEFQKYRDAANALGDRDQLGRDVFTRIIPPGTELPIDPGFADVSIFRLVEAMADVLSRLSPEKQHEVIADTVSISDCIERVLAFGEAHGQKFTFVDLFRTIETRRHVVVTFLALLEMARTRMLRIVQEQEPIAPPEPTVGPGPLDPPKPAEIWIQLTGHRPTGPFDGFEQRPVTVGGPPVAPEPQETPPDAPDPDVAED